MERELEYWPPGATVPVPIRVGVSVPTREPDGTWLCTLTIEGFDKPHSQTFPGSDALSALLTAISFAPLKLELRVPEGGRLTWHGDTDLGLATRSFDGEEESASR